MPQAGPGWGPKQAQNGPKSPKMGPGASVGPPRKVMLSTLMDKINLGTVWVASWPCLDPCGPEWPQMGSISAPNVSYKLKPKNGRISGSTDRNANPRTLFPRANPHCRWFPHPSEWPKRTAASSFCPPGARPAAFWGILAGACPPKRGQNGSKMILDHLWCLWRFF